MSSERERERERERETEREREAKFSLNSPYIQISFLSFHKIISFFPIPHQNDKKENNIPPSTKPKKKCVQKLF